MWHTPAPPMKFIRDILETCRAEGRPAISYEFFPPKTTEGERVLFEQTIPALLELHPEFCSVTYGAGGSTREKTLGIVDRLQREHGMLSMMHLTCVNATREELQAVIEDARACGITNILALRGDPPPGSDWIKTEGGFEYSRELVAFLRSWAVFPSAPPDFRKATSPSPAASMSIGSSFATRWPRARISSSPSSFSTTKISMSFTITSGKSWV